MDSLKKEEESVAKFDNEKAYAQKEKDVFVSQ